MDGQAVCESMRLFFPQGSDVSMMLLFWASCRRSDDFFCPIRMVSQSRHGTHFRITSLMATVCSQKAITHKGYSLPLDSQVWLKMIVCYGLEPSFSGIMAKHDKILNQLWWRDREALELSDCTVVNVFGFGIAEEIHGFMSMVSIVERGEIVLKEWMYWDMRLRYQLVFYVVGNLKRKGFAGHRSENDMEERKNLLG